MSQIDEATAKDVVDSLRALAEASWISITWELQDGAEFLLVRIELNERPFDRNAPRRMEAFRLLNERIPPKQGGDYSWMIVFIYRAEVVDSVMTGVA